MERCGTVRGCSTVRVAHGVDAREVESPLQLRAREPETERRVLRLRGDVVNVNVVVALAVES